MRSMTLFPTDSRPAWTPCIRQAKPNRAAVLHGVRANQMVRPEFANYQRGMDKAHPNTVNLLVNQSVDGKKTAVVQLLRPGSGLLYAARRREARAHTDRATHALDQTGPDGADAFHQVSGARRSRDPWLPDRSRRLPAEGPAVGRDAARRAVGARHLGFDPLVQLLANRGYAVLQMNYRGSTGYGDELYRRERGVKRSAARSRMTSRTECAGRSRQASPNRRRLRSWAAAMAVIPLCSRSAGIPSSTAAGYPWRE